VLLVPKWEAVTGPAESPPSVGVICEMLPGGDMTEVEAEAAVRALLKDVLSSVNLSQVVTQLRKLRPKLRVEIVDAQSVRTCGGYKATFFRASQTHLPGFSGNADDLLSMR